MSLGCLNLNDESQEMCIYLNKPILILTLPEPKDFEASRKKLEKLPYKRIWPIVFKQDTAV